MTAIAALVHEGKVWIGADSAGVSGMDLAQRSDSKVFKNRDMVMGFTSSFRMGQLLRWAFDRPDQEPDDSDEKYMSTAFVDGVRACLKTGGFAKKENEVESGGTFLVGWRGRIWEVHGDYQVGAPLAGFSAVGCGDALCLGALHATPATMDPAERLTVALSAAERFSAGVRSPFRIMREP